MVWTGTDTGFVPQGVMTDRYAAWWWEDGEQGHHTSVSLLLFVVGGVALLFCIDI